MSNDDFYKIPFLNLSFLHTRAVLGTIPEGAFIMYLTKEKTSPFWQIVYFVDGKRTKKSTKKTTKSEALKYLTKFDKHLKDSERPVYISLSKFRDEYVAYTEATKSKHYVSSVKLSFRMLLNFTGELPLHKLDVRTLDKFITFTYSRTKRSASLYYRTLKAAFSKAVVWNYLSDNPLKKLKSPKVAKSHPVFIAEDELNKILSCTKKEYLNTLFYTAFYTGMRLGELVNLKWNWIDFEKRIITVKCSAEFTTKSKKERIIPITQGLYTKLINRIPKPLNNYIFFRVPGIKLNEDFVSKSFKRSIKAAKLDTKVHFHTLRHSFASALVQRGASLYVVKELLGHENLSTTQIYSHLKTEDLSNAVNLL
jgi:integrase